MAEEEKQVDTFNVEEEEDIVIRPNGVKDVPASQFIKAYAEHLKQLDKIELPKHYEIAKTAPFKQLPPRNPDWYYYRAAAIARKIYIRQELGVGHFRKKFGSTTRLTVAPEHKYLASPGIIRHMLQSLEKLGYLEKSDTLKGGRRLTSEGFRDMDQIASAIECRVNLYAA